MACTEDDGVRLPGGLPEPRVLEEQARLGRALGRLIDNVVDAIVVVDTDLQVSYANRAAEDLVGRPDHPRRLDGLEVDPDRHRLRADRRRPSLRA